MKRTILVFIFAILIFSCKKNELKQDPYIDISEEYVIANNDGMEKHISVSSNCQLKVLNSFSWCTASILENGKDLYLKVSPNDSKEKRTTEILLTYDNISKRLVVEQQGKVSDDSPNKDDLLWDIFPANSFSNITYELGSDNKTRLYKINSKRVFINQNIKEQVFPGNIIKSKVDNISHLNGTNYTYNLIDYTFVSQNSILSHVNIIPSYESFKKDIQDYTKTLPTQNLEFSALAPIRYTSYRNLRLLGLGNIGLKLDEIIGGGKSYINNEMKRKTGILYSFSQSFFSVMMDYPERLIKEEVTEPELSELAYISNIYFGRTGLLLVESDYDFSLTKRVVSQIMRNEELEESNKNIIGNFKFWLITFKKDGLHVKNGDFSLVHEYLNIQTKYSLDDIIPLYFETNKLKDHTVNSLNLYVNLP